MISEFTNSNLAVCGGRLCNQSPKKKKKHLKKKTKREKEGKDTEEKGGSFSF